MEFKDLPVVALDIDDTLNVVGGSAEGPGWVRHRVTIPIVMHPWGAFGGDRLIGRTFTLSIRAGVLDWIRAHHEAGDVQFMWATTWGRWANPLVGQRFDLPSLPVLTDPATTPIKWGWLDDPAAWKAEALRRVPASLPLAWLDDSAFPIGRPIQPRA